MTRHLLVGYLATSTGRDALNLGIALAREQDARLHVVMIAQQDSAYAGIYPPAGGYGSILEEQLGAWLDEALAGVPDDVPATGHVVTAESDAEGLLAAAEQLDCSMIIIGGRRGGLLRRYRLGSVATTLLHTAPVPVALAPAGYEHGGPVGRLTAMFGPRMPYWMATMPDAASGIMCGSRNGEIRPGPRSMSVLMPSLIIPIPPIPVPTTMPKRSASTSRTTWPSSPSRPASRSASPVAATAKCVFRSWRRASGPSMYCRASKSFTSPATWIS